MPDIQLVIFELDGQQYGVEMNLVFGINRAKDFKVTKIPNTPVFVDGVINLRNKVIPLYNLRTKFKIHKDTDNTASELLIVNVASISIGLIVDEVIDIVKISEEDTEAAPDIISDLDNKYISSIGKLDGNMIIVLDVCKILSEKDYDQLSSKIS